MNNIIDLLNITKKEEEILKVTKFHMEKKFSQVTGTSQNLRLYLRRQLGLPR